MEVIAFDEKYIKEACKIWNSVVAEGMAFPQEDELTMESGKEFFSSQSFTGLAVDGGEVWGLYILHPNNVGRCGHISNASYAVKSDKRGNGIGEMLVRHSIKKASELGFRVLQFNAVVKSNEPAIRLYEKIGFKKLGIIPEGFRQKDGRYEDIIPHYIKVVE